MLDDSGTTAPGHHPSSSRTLTIHPLTQKGKDIVLGFKSGCTRSFLAVGQDSSSSATAFFFSVRFESDQFIWAAFLAYRPDTLKIHAPNNSWRITYLCIQSSMMVVVGASGDRTSDGNGAGR
ncbi:hypothetical protein ASPFODRAFT_57707 [Aspergillus luchuensis CBS 106.47]|uniref:Uncharacterized protein n=1 Tax=Aspergillus luchuensis (strain CBS 106.47) TaxID=1137211 RepID=A0A1M3TQQ3_ASPLC|nr:hypothetical protein ASPFODRAFT_57707 [Aspergillus luchuensis CBS 106.47]